MADASLLMILPAEGRDLLRWSKPGNYVSLNSSPFGPGRAIRSTKGCINFEGGKLGATRSGCVITNLVYRLQALSAFWALCREREWNAEMRRKGKWITARPVKWFRSRRTAGAVAALQHTSQLILSRRHLGRLRFLEILGKISTAKRDIA